MKIPEIFDQQIANLIVNFAAQAHRGQFRRDGVTPYVEHPKRVAEISMEMLGGYIKYTGYSQTLLFSIFTVALFHDVEEDTKVSLKEISDFLHELGPVYFGGESGILSIIESLHFLNKNNYSDYLNFILDAKKNLMAKWVKIADIKHNLSDAKKGSLRDKYLLALYVLEN
jgi:(p)ppGpp synthase/HD superfamily hydrolase